MKVKLLVYGALRDYFSSSGELDFDFDKECIVSDIIDLLEERVPASSELLSISRVALNNNFVIGDAALKDMDTVLLFPPSSGG